MAVPTVYRWDDTHAPQVTDYKNWTQIKNWFTKIFVTGYLENDGVTMKPPMGWAVTFDDTKYLVYVTMVGDPVAENLGTIRYDFKRQVTISNVSGSIIWLYEHQTTARFFDSDNSATNHPCVGTNDDQLKICPWVMIGTKRLFYNFSGYNNTVSAPAKPTLFTSYENNFTFHFVGNIFNDGANLGKNKFIGLMGRRNYHVILGRFYEIWKQPIYPIIGSRNYIGTFISNSARLVSQGAILGGEEYIGNPSIGLRYPYVDGGLYLKQLQLYDYVDKVYIGKVSGLYYPFHKLPLYPTSNNNNLIQFDGEGDYSGQKFIGLTTSQYMEFYINITENWPE